MNRFVQVFNGCDWLSCSDNSITSIIHLLDAAPDWSVPAGDLSIALLEPDASGKIHLQFFNDPVATDVMTFPGDPDDDHAGEIILCPEIAISASRKFNTAFSEELTLYLVHGWLHLAGLRDSNKAESGTMRQAETVCMHRLRGQGLLEAFHDRRLPEN